MPTIYDAANGCPFADRKILFDTNVWIAIDGFDPRPDNAVYSDFYASALKQNNVIVVTDYVIGEFFNRVCKIEYKIHHEDDREFRQFKQRRKTPPDNHFMEAVRDSCLHIIDGCEFDSAVSADCNIKDFISEIGDGHIDFTDLILREYCRNRGIVLVSHDSDFINCGIDFVTGNRRLLREAAARS